MFCPSCGTPPHSDDQKFCKVCGTNLVVVSQVLKNPAVGTAYTPGQVSPPPIVPYSPGAFPASGTNPPTPSASLPNLPYLEEAAKREKLRRTGWMMMGGGILFGILISIIGGALRQVIGPLGRAIQELGGLGGLLFTAGLFLWFYAKFVIKKPDMPQVIVVQQPAQMPGMTGGLHYPPPVEQAQLPPPPVSSYGPPFSVTEHTTHRLEVPYQPTSRDTQ